MPFVVSLRQKFHMMTRLIRIRAYESVQPNITATLSIGRKRFFSLVSKSAVVVDEASVYALVSDDEDC